MREWLKKILLVLAGLLLAILMGEVGLHLLGIEYPQFYVFDPVVGARLRPGYKGYWLKEGSGYVSINRDGWRDRDHAIQKPPNTVRIAVLGDSFAEALQVNQEETFWAVMEKQLQGCANLRGRQVEVLNFGVAGYGTTQELLTLEKQVWKYSPDIVLLAFTPGNDVSDNSPTLNPGKDYPFLVLRDGQLVLDDSRLQRHAAILSSYEKNRNWLGYIVLGLYILRDDYSRILQLIDHAEGIIQSWQPAPTGEQQEDRQGVPGVSMFTAIYHEPTDENWKEAWKITAAILLKMQGEAAQKGAQFAVVVLTSSTQVHPEAWVRDGLAKYQGVTDVFYPDHWMERFGQSHGIPVLLLGPSFQEYAMQHQVYLHGFKSFFRNTLGDGHWNQNGHRLAGEAMARWLCPQIR